MSRCRQDAQQAFYESAGEQAWIHDTGLTVKKALEQGGLELVEYAWLSVG